MNLPTAEEINPFPQSLDGQNAVRNFLGKSLEEAETLFRESSLTYQEDLMFMGAPVFRFYVLAAINYIQSDAANGDSDIVSCFAAILEYRLEFEPDEMAAAASWLASSCAYILEHYTRFAIAPEIYGDLKPRFESLRETFLRQAQK
jgi:hypothetical protein